MNRPNLVENNNEQKGSSMNKPTFPKNGYYHYGGKHYLS